MDIKTKKKIKKPTLSLVYAGSPYRVSTKCGGCHPKGLIVANQLKLLFFPPVPPNFWNLTF